MLSLQAISKSFGGVAALSSVDFNLRPGEVHALMGENGAGKSTLGKIIAGIHTPDSGRISLDNTPIRIPSPRYALRLGIAIVHQELAFCPNLSVAENLALGHYPRRLGFLIDRHAMRARAQQHLATLGVTLNVDTPVRLLSTAQEQLVQIAAAVGTGARILIFDEPTSSLAEPDAQRLFSLIDSLRARGLAIVYVSHRMPEIFRLADRITVLRDGRHVATLATPNTSPQHLAALMVGRDIPPVTRPPAASLAAQSAPALEVQHLASPPRFADISFTLRPGQILGLAGLVGAGRSEIAQAIFGLRPRTGHVLVNGIPIAPSTRAAMRAGIALVPEDRKRQGLVLQMSVRANTTLAMLPAVASLRTFLRPNREHHIAATQSRQLQLKSPSLNAAVSTLSGGNQQKVALAKWLARNPRILIVDEPTRGVDVGAKAAIHQILLDAASNGTAVLVISSELPELLTLADEILVIRNGRPVGLLPRQLADEHSLVKLMAGVD